MDEVDLSLLGDRFVQLFVLEPAGRRFLVAFEMAEECQHWVECGPYRFEKAYLRVEAYGDESQTYYEWIKEG